ncbi:glycosyltransferase family 4 protein [Herbaspirillum sp.]|uniref:glycosyltransferase family 4 protein n=1 Tax=Herbaspirillum sp. TaxID=1890675 RepID=UPI0031E33B99
MAKILYFVGEDWFFLSHFLDRAKAVRAAGHDVVVVARENVGGDAIRAAGFRFVPIKISRRGLNPLTEIILLSQLLRIYRREKPDLFHHVALKPILYGTFIARLLGKTPIVNAPVGMGFVFSSGQLLARCLRPGVRLGLHFLLNPPASKVVFENRDDLNDAIGNGVVRPEDVVLIRGAGVDLVQYKYAALSSDTLNVTLVARMLRDKGIGEFVEAARILHPRYPHVRFQLVGGPDKGNPASFSESQLRQWNGQSGIEWLGHRNDVPELLAGSNIVCLPSYREGLPKSLIEGMAIGRPIVTTDVPGCREVVEEGRNGLLVPPRDPVALAAALARLIESTALRLEFGAAGRKRAVTEFGSDIVIKETLALYDRLLPI